MTERTDNTKFYGHSIEEWHKMVDRYFDAETSSEEEKMLRHFLISPYCPVKEFDDIKAVMGFLATGRKFNVSDKENNKVKSPKSKINKIGKKHSSSKVYRWVAAAMIVCALGTTAWKISDNNKNICIAYIEGNKCTNTDEVMDQMKLSIKSIHSSETEKSVDNQMRDIIGTINDND